MTGGTSQIIVSPSTCNDTGNSLQKSSPSLISRWDIKRLSAYAVCAIIINVTKEKNNNLVSLLISPT
jgi:hypothetical protein